MNRRMKRKTENFNEFSVYIFIYRN